MSVRTPSILAKFLNIAFPSWLRALLRQSSRKLSSTPSALSKVEMFSFNSAREFTPGMTVQISEDANIQLRLFWDAEIFPSSGDSGSKYVIGTP